MTLRLMLSARTPTTKGNLQGDTQHRRLPTISSGYRINPGDKTTRVTTSTETDRHASSAKCKTTGRRSAAKGSRPTNLAWIPTDVHSGKRSMLLIPTQPILWRLQHSPSRIFSDELDGTPTSSSPLIPQLKLSLCAVSMVMFNKLSEIMTPFYGGTKIILELM